MASVSFSLESATLVRLAMVISWNLPVLVNLRTYCKTSCSLLARP